MRDGYLEVCSDCAPLERLREAWAPAQPLSDLHQAISHQHILVGLEPPAQAVLGDSMLYDVRKAPQALGSPRGEHDPCR